MPRSRVLLAAALMLATPAWAAELPTRKAGLWELKMEFVGRNLPAQVMKHCTDASTDKLMNLNFAGSNERACSKQDMKADGGIITVDSIRRRDHHVARGGHRRFQFRLRRRCDIDAGRWAPDPRRRAGRSVAYDHQRKWLGACAAGQRPGDIVMSNGMTMNVLDLQKRMPPG